MGVTAVADWTKLLDREDICKYLMYDLYDEETETYINKDDSIGFIYELLPQPGISPQLEGGLKSLLGVLPEGFSVQYHLMASPDTTPILDYWRRTKTMGGLFEEVIDNYKGFIESKNWDYICNSFQAPVRNFRLLISMKYGGKGREYNVFDKLFNPKLLMESISELISGKDGKVEKEFKANIDRMLDLKDRINGTLKSAGLHPIPLNPSGLIDALYPMLNPNHDYRNKPKGKDMDISSYIIANDTTFNITDEYMTIDGVHAKSLSVKEYPEYFSIGNVLDFTGEVFGRENFKSPFIITLNVTKYTYDEVAKMKRNAAFVLGQKMPYSMFPKLKFKHLDLNHANDKLEKNQGIFDINFSIFVMGATEKDLSENTGAVKAFFRTREFILEEDKYIHHPVLMANMPFGYDMVISEFLGRSRAVFEENVVDFSPVSADWAGNKPEMLLLSPRGQLMGFDIFSNKSGGFNAFVVGMTGSGKSVFLEYLALMYAAAGDNVWIMDIGGSYEAFTHSFGGQWVELSLDNPECVNPFTEITDMNLLKNYMEFLKNFFLLMGAPKESKLAEQQEKLLRSYLEEAILESYEKHGMESCVDTVVASLEKHVDDPRVVDFIRTMRPYTTEGQYGVFFNGVSKIEFTSQIVTLENRNFEHIPELRDPILMIMSFHISKEIYLNEKSGKRNIVICDEGHKFLTNPQISLFLIQLYRRARKHGASVILGTQSFEDLYGGEQMSEAGRVIVQNSFWNFFLMQKATSREALYKNDYFKFTEFEEELLDSVQPVAGDYGEVMLISESVRTKARLVLDKFMKTMFFTENELRSEIKRLVKEQGYTYTEAIEIAQKKVV